MAKKKVLFTSHTANFQKFNRPFMRMLSEQGYEVHYASMGEEEILDADKSFTVPFTRSPFKLSNVKAYRQLKEIIDREQYDIIHTHTPMGSVVTRLAARDARKKGTRVIYTAHGLHFLKGSSLMSWLIFFPVEWASSFLTDDIILINKEDYELTKRKMHAKRTHLLESGVGIDLSKYKVISNKEKFDLRTSHGYGESDDIFIYVAEFIPRKNHELLVKSFAEVRRVNLNAKLILCGTGELVDTIKSMATRLGVDKYVNFTGYTQKVNEYMLLSDIYVSTSKQEGQQLTLIESICCGLFPISSDIRGPSDVLDIARVGRRFKLNRKAVDMLPKIMLDSLNDSHDYTRVIERMRIFGTESAIDNMKVIYSYHD